MGKNIPLEQVLLTPPRRNCPPGGKKPSNVRGFIIRVSDQLRAGEISLFEFDQEEAEAAKARLDAKRKQRRERYSMNKDQINALRLEIYIPQKEVH